MELAVDANQDGIIRVHLVSNRADLVEWMGQLAQGFGPLPDVAVAMFRRGATHGDRHYFGFNWQHDVGDGYEIEQSRVAAFIAWLRPLPLEVGIEIG
jgi:hypothetical protein